MCQAHIRGKVSDPIVVARHTSRGSVSAVEQFEFFDINNPCIGVCENGANGLCKGCFRKREERQYWNSLNNDVKRQIVQACARRRLRAQSRKPESEEDLATPQQDLF